MSILTDADAQQNIADSLERVLENHQTRDSVMVDLLNEIAYNIRRVDLEKSFQMAKRAGEIANGLKYDKGIAESLNELANYYYLRADYPRALKHFEEAATIHRTSGFIPGLAFSLNGIGMTYIRQGNYSMALDYIQQSLRMSEVIEDQRGIAFSLYNVGKCYSNLGEFALAQDYFKRSLKLSEEINKKDFISVTLRDIGEMYTRMGNFAEAESSFLNAIEIMRELDDMKGISYTMVTLGMLYKKKNDSDLAFYYFTQAREMSEEFEFKHNLCNAYFCLAAIYYDRGDFSTALNYSLQSLVIAKELDVLPEQRSLYEQLSRIYASTGEFKRAYQSQSIYQKLNDSIFNEESIRKVAILESQNTYEKEKQKAELLQLQQEAVRQEENRWQKTVRNFFIGAFILTAVLSLIVFQNLIQRKKANKILSIQKNEIEIKGEKLRKKNEKINEQKSVLRNTLVKLKEAQSQLVQSEKMASVGVLTAGIAHEINNPLNFIHGGVSALQKYAKKNLKDHEEKLKPLLETIDLGIKRATGIVQSLNRFSHEGSGDVEKCDIHLIIDNCLLMLKNQLKDRVEIQKQYGAETYSLIGLEGELHQVLLNVLSNASQAIEDVGVITISTFLSKKKLVLEIEDTGCGISKDNLEKVTSPFFTTRDPGVGTGLGMSISYNIIRDHKGTIEIESEVGKGTLVRIKLPVQTEKA